MDSSGKIPPITPNSSNQPKDFGNSQDSASQPEGQRYTADDSAIFQHNKTPLPDYDISPNNPSHPEVSASLPEKCPEWFLPCKNLFQELAQFQQYFTSTKHQEAFLNGDGPCYNPLIINRLGFKTIFETESLTDEQKHEMVQWQDAAFKDCPIPWRELPLKLNHLNKEWVPSPEAAHFIQFDGKNRRAQQEAGDFIPDWMTQEVLGLPINDVTTQYWNLRNENAVPGKNFLTKTRLRSLDPTVYNWIALFKDPRVRQDSGLSERQIAVIEYRLSQADQEIAQHLKNERCQTKSHHYEWRDLVAAQGLYENIQGLSQRKDEAERTDRKRTSSQRSNTSSEALSTKPDSSQTKKPKRISQDSLASQDSVQESMSLSSSGYGGSTSLVVDGKEYPYSEDIKYQGKPNVQRRLKIYETPHIYDFETVSEDQIPTEGSSIKIMGSPEREKVAFSSMEVTNELFPVLEVSSLEESLTLPVKLAVQKLESLSYNLFYCQDESEAEELLKSLKLLQSALVKHFDKVYRQYTHDMYATVNDKYKHASPEQKEEMDMESLLSEEQHETLRKLLLAQDELCEIKHRAEQRLKELDKEKSQKAEKWQNLELLKKPMIKTRDCLLEPTEAFKEEMKSSEQISVPIKLLSKLKKFKAGSHEVKSGQMSLSTARLCAIVYDNLELIKKLYGSKTGVWDQSTARNECDNLIEVFNYFVESLRIKSTEEAQALNNFRVMDELKCSLLNFRNALKGNNHTKMNSVLTKQMKEASTVIARLSADQ